jgi:uncharacterized protein YdaU (DUF1376 family)
MYELKKNCGLIVHYYQFNIADYRKDTGHLNIIEHGIYRQLIDWYYLDETPIPKETQVVMRRLCLGSDNLHLLQNVLADFFILADTGYLHKRIEVELERYKTQFAKNRVNGTLGGRPRKTQVVSENNHMATQTEPKITLTNNQEPLTNKPLTIIKPIRAVALDNGFNEFYNAYPKKKNRTDAEKAWGKRKPPIDEVLKALAWQKQSKEWQKQGGDFIPYPASYINAGGWMDEPVHDDFVSEKRGLVL